MDSREIQLAPEELELYKKSAGSTWFMTKEMKHIDEYGNVNVTTLSPYSFNLPDDQRPRDDFDSRETLLDFHEFEDRISIKIFGKGREEHIEATINGQPMTFDGSELVLTMNNTFSEKDMVLLLRKAERLSNESVKIGDALEIWTANDLAQASRLRVQDYFATAIYNMSRENFSTIIVPVVTRGRPFDPEQPELTRGHHWYTCMLSFEDPHHPMMTIIDSSNKLKAGVSISNIIDDYEQSIAIPLNNVLRLLDMSEIQREEIRYAQGTQYGNMGCGITASRNIERLLSGETFESLTERSEKTSMIYEQVFYYDEKGASHEEFNISEQRLAKLQQRYGEDNVCTTKGQPYFRDISVKGNIVLEALQRFELARQISFNQKFQRNIEDIMAIPQPSALTVFAEHRQNPAQFKTIFHGLLKKEVPSVRSCQAQHRGRPIF